MHDINFEYKSSYNIFENAQILFKKNNIYSISGESGSGKPLARFNLVFIYYKKGI